jgi:hypothetical protein
MARSFGMNDCSGAQRMAQGPEKSVIIAGNRAAIQAFSGSRSCRLDNVGLCQPDEQRKRIIDFYLASDILLH